MIAAFMVSMEQALGIWGDLVEAYHGVNGYGGHVSEIYMYRLMPCSPTAELGVVSESRARELEHRNEAARHALASIVRSFRDDYEATVTIDGASVEQWLATSKEDHRVHVTVFKRT